MIRSSVYRTSSIPSPNQVAQIQAVRDPQVAMALQAIRDQYDALVKYIVERENAPLVQQQILNPAGLPVALIGSKDNKHGIFAEGMWVGPGAIEDPDSAQISVDEDGVVIDASALALKMPVVDATWADADPSGGSVSWTSATVKYNTNTYSITPGNTANAFIYWDVGSPTTFTGTNTWSPQVGRFLIATNNSGTHDTAWDKVASNGIARASIYPAAVGETELDSGAVTEAKIGTAAVTEAKIGTAAVTEAKIGTASVTEAKIGSAAVTNAKIGLLAVGTAQIADAAIEEAKIGSLAVTEAKIGAAAVTNAKIGLLAVGTAQIADAAIEEAKIGSLAVTEAKIGAAAVTNAKIGNLAVDTAQIANAAITNAKVNDLDAGKITAGTLNTTRLDISQIIVTGTFSSNSPGSGSVAWSSATVYFKGTSYSITNGNTSSQYVYWDVGNTTFGTSTAPAAQANRFLILVNDSGTAIEAWHGVTKYSIGEDNIMAGTIPEGYEIQDPATVSSIDLTTVADTTIISESDRGILISVGLHVTTAPLGTPTPQLKFTIDGGTTRTVKIYESTTAWTGKEIERICTFSNGSGSTIGDIIVVHFNVSYRTSLVVKVSVPFTCTAGVLQATVMRALKA